MTKRGGQGDANATPARNRRPNATEPKSIAAAQDATAEAAHRGRPGGGTALSGESPTRPGLFTTAATGQLGGTPVGHPTRVGRGEDVNVQRSLELENSGAVVLAGRGYRVRQNPTSDEVARARQDTGDTGDPGSKPDYLLEGRVFDCYSPTANKPPRGIWWEVEDKVVARNQTQRVVVNLEDWRGDMSALRKQFADWPIRGLREVKAITPDGDIVQISIPTQ